MKSERTLRPEDLISHYRVVGPLGVGGMGEVYLARDQSLDRNVALKVLPAELVKNEERVRRFVLEAKSASSLSHPNIVTIYEIGQDVVRSGDGDAAAGALPVQFISMELIQGKTLSTLIHDEKADVRTLLGSLAQAGEGIAKAHSAGIVHRDLKPGNIMVTQDGFAKVLDFGLAKLTERREADPDLTSAPTRAPDATGEGMLLGTTGYMSPEQVQGKAVDHRSDIFSFGCVLYEAVTRARPFSADSAIETMHRILHEKPAPIEEKNPRAPAELRRLVRRCLAKSPDQRIQSMKDVALELREIVDEWDSLAISGTSTGSGSGASAVRSGTALPTVTTRASSVRVLLGGFALVVLVAIAAAVWAIGRGRKEVSAPPAAPARISTQTTRSDVVEAAISADGRYLAYMTGTLVGKSSVRVRQVATGSDLQVVPPQDGTLSSLSFSPDGNYLFYLRRRRDAPTYRALMQVPSLGGESRERAFDVDTRASFSPDGKQFAFTRIAPGGKSSDVIVRDLESGSERVLASASEPREARIGPAWSPDGREIAFAILDASKSPPLAAFAIVDVQSGRQREIEIAQGAAPETLAWLPDGSGLVWSGLDSRTTIARQISVVSYPSGRTRRITNDFNDYAQVTISTADEAIAAVRRSRISNLWLVDPAGGEAHPLTNFTSAERSPKDLTIADDGRVLFSSALDESLRLWSIGPGGGEPKAISPEGALAFGPLAVRGGAVYDQVGKDGVEQAWRIDLDGGDAKPLVKWPASLRDAARDGSFVILERPDLGGALWLVPLTGGQPRDLANKGLCSISPDGSRILVAHPEPGPDGLSRRVVRSISTNGGSEPVILALPPQVNAMNWGSDSSSVFYGDRDDPAWNISRLRLSSNAKSVPVTRFTEGRCTLFEPSPDGRKLAVARVIGDAMNVWVMSTDGSNLIQASHFPADTIFDLQWTRDSAALVVNVGKRNYDAVLIRGYR